MKFALVSLLCAFAMVPMAAAANADLMIDHGTIQARVLIQPSGEITLKTVYGSYPKAVVKALKKRLPALATRNVYAGGGHTVETGAYIHYALEQRPSGARYIRMQRPVFGPNMTLLASPEWPESAWKENQSRTIAVRIRIHDDGLPVSSKVPNVAKPDAFQKAALSLVGRAAFLADKVDGEKIRSDALLSIRFKPRSEKALQGMARYAGKVKDGETLNGFRLTSTVPEWADYVVADHTAIAAATAWAFDVHPVKSSSKLVVTLHYRRDPDIPVTPEVKPSPQKSAEYVSFSSANTASE